MDTKLRIRLDFESEDAAARAQLANQLRQEILEALATGDGTTDVEVRLTRDDQDAADLGSVVEIVIHAVGGLAEHAAYHAVLWSIVAGIKQAIPKVNKKE